MKAILWKMKSGNVLRKNKDWGWSTLSSKLQLGRGLRMKRVRGMGSKLSRFSQNWRNWKKPGRGTWGETRTYCMKLKRPKQTTHKKSLDFKTNFQSWEWKRRSLFRGIKISWTGTKSWRVKLVWRKSRYKNSKNKRTDWTNKSSQRKVSTVNK